MYQRRSLSFHKGRQKCTVFTLKTMFPFDTSFTVFDLETTGLNPRAGDRIVEIAGIRLEKGVIVHEYPFLSLVNPEKKISWEAQQVHRIPPQELRTAPTIIEILPKFFEFAQNSTLIAHNAEFDLGFLESEKEFCWGYVEIPECLCTLRLSKAVFPYESCHTLNAAAKRLQLPLPSMRHRALPDVLLTAQIFLRLLEQGKIQSLSELREKASLKYIPCR